MFGYVTINKEGLSEEEYQRFQSYYCGLCRVLKEKYKRRGQAILNYDMAFLTVLLTSLYESENIAETIRCIPHHGKKQEILRNEMTEYAADMNLALVYHKCLDNWADDGSRSQHMVAKILESCYEKIKKKYPRQCRAMERELELLSMLEKGIIPEQEAKKAQNCAWSEKARNLLKTAPKKGDVDIDSVANCFGRLTAEIFVYREDEWREALWNMGFALGKFIYLMDAYDDVEKDKKKGSFNPLLPLLEREDFEAFCHQMLMMTMADCSRSFELLPLIEDIGILRNVIYSGVWTKYDMIQIRKKKEQGKGQS